MINGFYTIKEFKNNENEIGSKKFSDPEFVKELMTGVTSKVQMIDAIEKYNTDHKLNEKERIKYSIGISDTYINVLKATKISETTYAIVGYDFNGYGNLVKSQDPNKSNKFETAISTHIVDVDDIVDVWFGGYNQDHLANIFASNGVDEISAKAIETILIKLKNELNAIHASGEYRLFFNKFIYEMKKNKLNELTYEHRTTAYNTYTYIWTKYIAVIKDILANFHEIGYLDEKDPVFFKKSLLFVQAENDEQIKTKLKNMFKESYSDSDSESIEENVEHLFLRTFGTKDIERFEAIISEE